jgi:polysaccharide export outer membrane protein
MKITQLALLLLLASVLSACASTPGTELDSGKLEYANVDVTWPNDKAPQPADFTIYRITPKIIAELKDEELHFGKGRPFVAPKARPYLVGPNDVLSIVVYEHPELTIPAGQFQRAEDRGHRVDTRGIIYFPYVGELHVAGKTVAQVRDSVTEALTSHIPNPQVVVSVAAYKSKKITLTGDVGKEGRISITDDPMTLVRAISQSRGETGAGDLGSVIVTRGTKRYIVNVEAYLRDGDLSQNMMLQDGDIVHVPSKKANLVYVIGEFKESTELEMVSRRMNLAEAISKAGGPTRDSDVRKVFVFRAVGEGENLHPVVYHLNLKPVEGMVLASRFPLRVGDVVYVSTSKWAKWQRIWRQVLPFMDSAYRYTNL